MLYVVATPIGNMSDITHRALKVLAEVSLIACEDTRHTRKILSKYNISTRCVSCHSFNEMNTFKKNLLPLLEKGESVALVSDAGTPLVSDPGAALVEAAYQHNIPVSPIPGASAVSTLLSVSGLHGKGYCFEGFLGRKSGQRKKRLRVLLERNEAFILFESPYRLLKLLGEITDIDNTREVLFGREMTKTFETFQKGPVSNIFAYWNDENKTVKGECSLLVYTRKK